MPIPRLQRLTGFLALLFLPLSAGALWSILSLRYQAELPAMAILCALALWPAREYLGGQRRWGAACSASFCCACGIFYAAWLKAALLITQTVNIGFIDSILSIGLELVIAIFLARASVWSIALIALALLLAGWMGHHASGSKEPRF